VLLFAFSLYYLVITWRINQDFIGQSIDSLISEGNQGVYFQFALVRGAYCSKFESWFWLLKLHGRVELGLLEVAVSCFWECEIRLWELVVVWFENEREVGWEVKCSGWIKASWILIGKSIWWKWREVFEGGRFRVIVSVTNNMLMTGPWFLLS
jgi:hypothetical protein